MAQKMSFNFTQRYVLALIAMLLGSVRALIEAKIQVF